MPFWTHLIRFVAEEDEQIHFGQLQDTSRDIGKDSVDGVPIKAYKIIGDIYNGKITDKIYTVRRLLSPVTREQCNYIRCMGLNYRDHAVEANLPLPAAAEVFTKPRYALADPYPAAVTIPLVAQDGTSDYEAELCLVIGKTGRDISEEDAYDYILGYTASNDISARTIQLSTKQWSLSKGFDNSCPIGPVLVAPSVVGDPQKLFIKAIYNGREVQNGNTENMVFDIKHQIASLSRGTTLEAGTIILTGTPAGIGFFKKPRVFLEDGSTISVEIEKIGTLTNKVVYEKI